MLFSGPMPDEERRVVLTRRLVLAKELHSRGVAYSMKSDGVSKMIAVHLIHNSLEVLLRAVATHYDLRDRDTSFALLVRLIAREKPEGKVLGYKRELLNINGLRNMVQHDAHEPTESAMEECRVRARAADERSGVPGP